MKQSILLTTIGVLTVGALLMGTTSVFAEDSTTTQQSLVQKIAARFSLKESDVQAVFDESRAERQAARQAEMKAILDTRLNEAIANGKITEQQKQLILAKHAEMQQQHEADRSDWQTKTPEEKRAAMETRRTELETWATQNGIDFSYIAGGNGEMMGRGPGMGKAGGRNGGMGEGRFAD